MGGAEGGEDDAKREEPRASDRKALQLALQQNLKYQDFLKDQVLKIDQLLVHNAEKQVRYYCSRVLRAGRIMHAQDTMFL